ncbi:helix-turn-helix transcriptional regulator [Pseudoalteromonas luteoviolacea]|uniref:helix-turn-helix transcriptional regulator n=1 Tax=Pseudoalteromonas luteoviolacea TaxID=43657 RepID=UPI001F186A43|nr:helix-turn-helix transcriptional regulator [Pseudoalteromonas luteoviolacea]MCF6441709.1 helix-turn-helix transcriptional regulator [Pseudoalteromonas luteoviolacea]
MSDIKQRRVDISSGLNACLTYYPANSTMAMHEHEGHQLSIVLSGALAESSSGVQQQVYTPSLCTKPAEFGHANQYGKQGTLIFALNFSKQAFDEYAEGVALDWHWQPLTTKPLLQMIKQSVKGIMINNDPFQQQFLWDLLAIRQGSTVTTERQKVAWLLKAKQSIECSPDNLNLTQLAVELGVHPVYFSRSFHKHFGCAPSLYQQRCKVSRAMQLLSKNKMLVEVANDSGFSDQSHLTRLFKQEIGFTPRQLKQFITG